MHTRTPHTAQCPFTDTTTLNLVKAWLPGGKITEDALYNLVIGQTVLPSWRRLDALQCRCAAVARGVCRPLPRTVPEQTPPHLKQGVLSLLGNGPEAESCGRFTHGGGSQDSSGSARRLPEFRALLVARRLLSIADPTWYDMEQRDIGDFAELGLWLLLGLTTEEARAVVGKSPFKAGVGKLFLASLEALPSALAAVDQHGIVERLARLHLLPTCAQCVERMLCDWRKMCLPEGRTARGDPFPGYKETWLAVAPILARRASAC